MTLQVITHAEKVGRCNISPVLARRNTDVSDIFLSRNEAEELLYALQDEEPGVLLRSAFEELPLVVEVAGPVAVLQRGEGRAAPRQAAGDEPSDGGQGDQNPAQHLDIII